MMEAYQKKMRQNIKKNQYIKERHQKEKEMKNIVIYLMDGIKNQKKQQKKKSIQQYIKKKKINIQ